MNGASAWVEELLEPLDRHLAHTLAELGHDLRPEVRLAIQLLSAAVRRGHVCLDLHDPLWAFRTERVAPTDPLPPPAEWMRALRESPLVGEDPDDTPLVLDRAGRLYLRRYWKYERQVAEELARRAQLCDDGPLPDSVRELARELFHREDGNTGELDWQQVASLVALRQRFCVITGGPGTGKTYSVANVLVLLFALAQERRLRPPRVELLAPTGKAAARLAESLAANKKKIEERGLPLAAQVLPSIPTEAKTIHRSLGTRGESAVSFYHDAENPLLADVIVVDEASMIDLGLMAHLLAAVPPEARLILLGDEYQLASVEAGAVLGDICNLGAGSSFSVSQWRWLEQQFGRTLPVPGGAPPRPGLWDCVVRLRKNYRYGRESGIGRLAEAVRTGNADAAWEAVESSDGTVSKAPTLPPWELSEELAVACRERFAPYLQSRDPAQRLEQFGTYRVLSGNRYGPNGSLVLNRAIERELAQAGLLANVTERWYDGRPVLVTENNYWVRLFNGDLGIVMVAPNQEPRVAFPGAGSNAVRLVATGRLPAHETAFAMTIHKSQGSEFDHVEVVLPLPGSPLLTRELLYTAITRAKKSVRVHADEAAFKEAVRRRTERSSGLRDALWGTR